MPDRKTVLITAGVAGVLFGLHPLHVESVAWVSERKDLLYALFFLMSMVMYINYAMARMSETGTTAVYSDRYYLASILFFVLSLASKPMAVTLPLVLLLIDWYPLNRVRSMKDGWAVLTEKGPFMLLSLLASAVAIIAGLSVGATASLEALPASMRILAAFRAIALYLRNMVIPLDLVPLYPYPKDISVLSPASLAAIVLVAGITTACVQAMRKHPLWLSVWIYFVISLMPVLPFVQFGSHFMADRYTYLPSLGPFLLAGLATARGWEKATSPAEGGAAVKWLAACTGVILCLILSYATVRQIAVWKDSMTLWNYVIEKEPVGAPVAYLNRGVVFEERGRFDLALEDYGKAIVLDTARAMAPVIHENRGILLTKMGRLDQALEDYNAALSLRPDYVNAYNSRGMLYKKMGQPEKAIRDFTAAIGLAPARADVYVNRGIALKEMGQFDRALADYDAALAAVPHFADAYTSRGIVFREMGQFDRAIEEYSKAIASNPSSVEAYNNRGVAYKHKGLLDRAVRDYQKAIEIDPSFFLSYCNMGIALGMLGRANEGIEQYTKALSLNPGLVMGYLGRGDLYEKTGKRDLAVMDYQKACDLGSSEGCALASGRGIH